MPCPGPVELLTEHVPAGMPCPTAVLASWRPGSGYAIAVDVPPAQAGRTWTDAQRAAARKRNLAARVEKVAPLFAEEFTRRELAAHPNYFDGKKHPQPGGGS